MIQAKYVHKMATYNRWMNSKIYEVCGELSDAELKMDRGAFFKSIHSTLNHILVGDKLWLGRLTATPFVVNSLAQELCQNFDELLQERIDTDRVIDEWAHKLTNDTLLKRFEYTTMVDPQKQTKELWLCVTHLFQHQIHHRGQITTMLYQIGKDCGSTDLVSMPEDY